MVSMSVVAIKAISRDVSDPRDELRAVTIERVHRVLAERVVVSRGDDCWVSGAKIRR